MTLVNGLILLAVCFVLSACLSLPIILYMRFAKRRRPAAPPRGLTREVPTRQLPWLVALIAMLFLGLSQAYLSPDTWFGHQMTTVTGEVVYAIAVYLTAVVLNVAWRWLTILRARRQLAMLMKRDVDGS